MDYEEKVEFLRKYKYSIDMLKSIDDEILQIDTQLMKYGSSIIPPPQENGNYTSNAIARLVGRKIDLEEQHKYEREECKRNRLAVVKVINTVKDLDAIMLLRYRYINCWTFDKIANEMPYNDRQAVHRKHKKIIDELQVDDKWLQTVWYNGIVEVL